MKDISRFLSVRAVCSFLMFVFFCSSVNGKGGIQAQPNIILIYIDDLGYSDLGCYGRKYGNNFIETPNIDRFAKQSLKFTSAYTAAPICSPARAALLTGKTPARLKFEFVTKWENDSYQWDDTLWTNRFSDRPLVPPPYTLNLPLEERTVAEILKSEGYSTAMVGKWHVSTHHQVYNGWNPDFGPSKQGFDWAKETFGAWGNDPLDIRNYAREGGFPRDGLTNEAISYIKQQHQAPFFLYVSHYYVHTPLDAELTWIIDKYEAKAKHKGIKISDQRIRYAAFVETLDYYIGQLLRAIDEAGLSENTLVVLTSDNGGMPEFAFNRPFRGSKWNLYEGGIRIPMLMRWPGVIKGETVSRIPVMQTDLLPTFYEIASGKHYRSENIDGRSILPWLKGASENTFENRSLIWHFPYYHPEGRAYNEARPGIGIEDEYVSQTRPHSALQTDGYKLLYFYENEQMELYNLRSDSKEAVELSVADPTRAKAMKEELLNYLESVDARIPRRDGQ